MNLKTTLLITNMNPIPFTLRIYVPNDNEELYNMYVTKINEHNENGMNNPMPDSGFDLFVPEEKEMLVHQVNKIGFKVKCEMTHYQSNNPSPFYMYPRSSISKSNFRMANNVGIIDSGYRGELIGMFDVVYTVNSVTCKKYTRLLQICAPDLSPFRIELVENDSDFIDTERGTGGFGSTGGTNNAAEQI